MSKQIKEMEDIVNRNQKLRQSRSKPNRWNGRIKTQLSLQSMVIPGLVFLIIFSYLPMFGVIIAFKDYDLYSGILGSPWVGFRHFVDFFTDKNFGIIMRNTICISFLKLLFGFPAPIIFAVMLNEVRCSPLKRTFQTITYLPYFLSWVIVSGMIISLLAVDGGTINVLLEKMGLIDEEINFLSEPNYFWTILVGSNVWKNTGFNAVIFIAAIAGINQELYEAASVDGASRFKQIFIVTLPSIIPQIMIMLIMQVANILNAGFDDILLLTNNGTNTILRNVSEVIDTYVYRMGLSMQRYSYATAVGILKTVVNVSMLVAANAMSRKLTDTSLW